MNRPNARRWRVGIPLATVAAAVVGCHSLVSTDLVINAFNSGALDTSGGDPFHDPAVIPVELVDRAIRGQLDDGYFGQGHAPPMYVARWMRNAVATDGGVADFVAAVEDDECQGKTRIGKACAKSAERASNATADAAPDSCADTTAQAKKVSRNTLLDATLGWADGGPKEPLCETGVGDLRVEEFADFVRFSAAVDRAAQAVAPLLTEGLVNEDAIEKGMRLAFDHTATYLDDREWRRSRKRRTTGLVVKGGASTGIYSAGVVWVALNVIRAYGLECKAHPEECGGEKSLRFDLLSGTSTGALISVATDLFANANQDAKAQQDAIDNLARWFTCSSENSLYCARSAPALALARTQSGLVEFQGLQATLDQQVSCAMMTNRSELILNTVDFRTGRLYALSDQDRHSLLRPSDIVQGALASAVLPVIAKPVTSLPVNYSAKMPLTYLDGGIRSELPITPLVERGAERVLVVSSSASVLGESPPLKDAVDIAARYIDVSTGGVTESEIGHATAMVEAMRLAEIDTCRDWLAEHPLLCGKSCNAAALCRGDWDNACKPQAAPEPTRSDDRIDRLWQMVTFFRDEKTVEALHGYTFDSTAQRNLFLAGADAARLRCGEIAQLLGMDVTQPQLRAKLSGWCSPALSGSLCPANANTDSDVASCGGTDAGAPKPNDVCRAAEKKP
jgi:predicted acylesterase/phospholipase RssA